MEREEDYGVVGLGCRGSVTNVEVVGSLWKFVATPW